MERVSAPQPVEPGWYDDPDGKRRWWSGSHWGAYAPWSAPSESAQPEARPDRPTLDRSLTFDPTASGRASRARGGDADRPQRGTGPLPRPAAGGGAPGAPARPRPAAQPPEGLAKQLTTAYLLLIVLGLLGAHRYYLGRLRSGIAQMMLSFAACAALVMVLGASRPMTLLLLAVPLAAAIWWISDLFRTSAMVREHNRRAR